MHFIKKHNYAKFFDCELIKLGYYYYSCAKWYLEIIICFVLFLQILQNIQSAFRRQESRFLIVQLVKEHTKQEILTQISCSAQG